MGANRLNEGEIEDGDHPGDGRQPETGGGTYRNGKEKLFGFFVGEVMKQTNAKGQSTTLRQRPLEKETERVGSDIQN